MHRRLPPLNAVRAFEAVARNGSVTGAARELCVTQGAVSRHVTALEGWLGATLFHRTQRGVTLTTKGSAYFRTINGALDQIDFATRQVQAGPDANLLRLKLPPTFAIRWLVPRLAAFHALHPGIDVQITTSHDRADFDREDVDACIHSEHEAPAGPGLRRLFGEVLLPVCSPGLAGLPSRLGRPGGLTRRKPRLREPADLARYQLLCSLNRPHDWPTWLAAAGVPQIDGNGGLKFDNAALAYQAAIDELGVMIAQRALVDDDIAAGRLVAPFDMPVRTTGAYYLAYAPNRPRSARVAAFEDWIVAAAQDVRES